MSEQFNMADIDLYATRAVEKITIVARRASRFATAILLFVVIACAGGFLLGWAALDDNRNVWFVLGGFFGVWAIGAALLGRWRVGSVKNHVPELATEIRGLLSQGRTAGTQVIETFVVDDPDGTGAIRLGRTMWGFKGVAGTGTAAFARLTATVTALTSYPVLALIAVLISLVFLALSPVFLLLLLF